ncbi:hypothetical protein NEMIN01_1199 [Nematocida minor]|uniref:uncharacterized protein n=1 Tax=Nematocida minor TaxID=1912983 RepID=UPI00221F77BB|nr:uncharacterized protein NEMIN01_1199 [Nematocida minor]KAI5190797.1 hypothetical protein NEMIN01_1199 [Nematocida minor]
MDKEAVHEFCNLLSYSDRCEVLSLLLQYSNSIDKLAFLFNRAEEYKLVLSLSQKKSSEYLRALQNKLLYSVAVGAVLGMSSAILIGCL